MARVPNNRSDGAQPVVLCVRDPDYSNEFTVDGDVRVIDIDMGTNMNGFRDLMCNGLEDALERVAGWATLVAPLPVTSNVRCAVEALIDAADDIIDDYTKENPNGK